MFKSILVGLLLLVSTSTIAHHNLIQVGGGVRCQTYDCQLAQQEIQYLLNAIYWEQQKLTPNWAAIQEAQRRIQWLRTIR